MLLGFLQSGSRDLKHPPDLKYSITSWLCVWCFGCGGWSSDVRSSLTSFPSLPSRSRWSSDDWQVWQTHRYHQLHQQNKKAQSIQFDLLIFNCVIWNFSTRSRMLLRHLHLQSLQKVTCLPLLSATHLTLTQLQLHALAGRNSLHLPFQRKEPFFLQKGAGYGSFRSGLEQLWANIVPTTSQTHSENVYIFTIYCRV